MINKKRLLSKILILAVPLVIIGMLINRSVMDIMAHSGNASKLLINEVMADNLSALKNEKDVYADWIEIYNPTDSPVNLGDYYLSDSKNELTKWAFPDISIDSGGYLIVFCDNDISEDNVYPHTNFSINAGKETIYLSDAGENIVDSVKLIDQQCDISYGRLYGGNEETGFLPYSTPGYANPIAFRQGDTKMEDMGEVIFSKKGGIYNEAIEVELSCNVPGAAIVYTLDGSEPGINSKVYSKAIKITDEGRPNQYTVKKCVAYPSSGVDNADTAYGVNEVYKGTVIRARIIKDAKMSATVQTNSYFINADYTMPIVSLTAEPDALFDDNEGQYVLGYTYYTMRKYGYKTGRGNYYIQADITGYVEVYDAQGCLFRDDIIFALSGGSSVSGNIQKSFNVTLNNNKITDDIFGGAGRISYEGFSIRGPGGGVVKNVTYTYPSSFITNYLSGEGIGAQRSRPCILFIDGEYWGIYNLMEPKGKEYIENQYGVSKKDISIVKPYERETTEEFDALFQEIEERNFDNSSDYAWLKTKINVDSFVKFVMADAFFANTDGIKNGDHNYYIWKADGGLWNWQVFDFDSTMVDGENYLKNIIEFEFYDAYEEKKKNFSSFLFQKLWSCEAFRTEFEGFAKEQCSGLYKTESIMEAFDTHINELAPEMEENLMRCEMGYTKLKQLSFKIRGIEAEYENYTMDDWNMTIDEVKRFLTNRTELMVQFIDEIMAI